MRMPGTLSRYIGRQFLIWFSISFGGLIGLILLLDTVELMRRASGKPDATIDIVLSMALLKLPYMAQEAVPFAILFGGMAAFWRMARNSEMVVVRAAGVSAWQFLLPVLLIAFGIGIFKVTVFNPLAAVTLSRFEQIEGKYLRGKSSLLAVSSSGIWLRQADDYGQAVVHARQVSPQGMEMEDVIILMYEGEDRFVKRIDAASAVLEDGYWLLKDCWITSPEQPSRYEPEYTVKTDLTVLKIQDSFATPATISFWDLPAFINTLEKAGFSGVRHRLYFDSLLSDPLLLCAMVLFSGAFALRAAPRRTAVVWTISGGILTGFLLYFLSDVVAALGQSATVPVALAAWTPAIAAILIGVSLLIHIEEG